MSFAEDGELSGATATATPGSETQVGSGEGLGEAPAVGEAKPKETTAEGAEAGEAATAEEGQPPAPLPEGWQGHPDAEPIFQDHYNKGRGERERQLRGEMDRREERYGTEIKDAFRQGTAVEVVTRFVEALEESIGLELDSPEGAKALGKVLRGHREWAEVFTNTSAQGAEVQFARAVKSVVKEAGLSEEVTGQLSDLEGELSWKVRHREATLADGVRELIKASFKHIKALGAQEEKGRRDKLESEMTGAADRATERGKKPPPAAPSGAGAGKKGSYTSGDLKKMTREQIMALPESDRDQAMKSSH